MDTLAVRLTIPPVGFVGDFHSLVSAPCRAHKPQMGTEQTNSVPISAKVAEPTGFEPATSDVTGRRSNQLNYDSAWKLISNFKSEI